MSLNPVMPSLIWGALEASFPDARNNTIEGALKGWAQRSVESDGLETLIPAVQACDAVMVCQQDDAPEDIERAVESILQQDDVHVLLHLIADGIKSWSKLDKYQNRSNVHLHRHQESLGHWQRIHQIAPHLVAPFMALVAPGSKNSPERLKTGLELLERDGGEFAMEPQANTEEEFDWVCPVPWCYKPETIPWWTLIIRRATLVDMGGFATLRDDAGSELVHRAICEKRHLMVTPCINVKRNEAGVLSSVADDSLTYTKLNGPLRQHADGYRFQKAKCDVVLPFKDSLDQVKESLHGLLQQRDADLVIHLIDDASDGPTDDFLKEYCELDNVRLYRNRRNLGPFATFNNICEFAETDYIAVQDADDISMPDRFATSYHLLRNSGADIVGSRTELFGENDLVERMKHETIALADGRRVSVRTSRYPGRHASGYYLENPTLLMRRQAFESLGGYADFGEGKRNRTGVDTELQVRAHFARLSIAVTRDMLVRYRCHGNSATNHQDSGLGSLANQESHAEVRKRFKRYVQGSFDPRWFGALELHRGVTKRLYF